VRPLLVFGGESKRSPRRTLQNVYTHSHAPRPLACRGGTRRRGASRPAFPRRTVGTREAPEFVRAENAKSVFLQYCICQIDCQ